MAGVVKKVVFLLTILKRRKLQICRMCLICLKKVFFNIVTDRLGHIWISTNKRVIEYEPKNGGIMDYSTMDDILVNLFYAKLLLYKSFR